MRKLKMTEIKCPQRLTDHNEWINSNKSQNKGDNRKIESESDSEIKIKRTVFKDYKESAILPDMRNKQSQRDKIKRGSGYSNSIDANSAYNNAVIQNDKPKNEPNKIIKKIAESLDAWHINK